MKKIKICFISPTYNKKKCGVSDYTEILAGKLKQKGYGIDIVTSVSPRGSDYRKPEKHVYNIGINWGWADFLKISKILKKTDPDIIHIQYQSFGYKNKSMINLLPFILRIRPSKKKKQYVIVTIHDLSAPFFMGIRIRLFRMIGQALWLTLMIIFCDFFIISNGAESEILRKSMPSFLYKSVMKKSSILPIPSSIPVIKSDGDSIKSKKEQLGIEKDEKIIIFFGFIRPAKGIETLLLSTKEIIKKGRKVKLIVLGGVYDDDYYKKMLNLSKKLGIERSVFWTGFKSRKEASEILNVGDVCVMPYEDGVATYRSSFATVVEHGLPIITTKGDTLPKGIKNMENVLLFDINNMEQLSESIMLVLDDDALRNRLRKGALNYSKRISWDSTISNTERVYNLFNKKNV